MSETNNIKYNSGHRYFINLDFSKGEKLIGQLLTDATFDNCYFSVDFSQTNFTNTKFTNCNLKCSDFSLCNLTNTIFENCSLENIEFKNAETNGTSFTNCVCYGKIVMLNKISGEIELNKHQLVKELYDNVPEFLKITDHSDDELPYTVYGNLSIELRDNIVSNNHISDFTQKCFQFFNILGNRNNESIDNILVVGIYEGLYSNKRCNDIARQLLTGRSKDIYEHWMINGNIQAKY